MITLFTLSMLPNKPLLNHLFLWIVIWKIKNKPSLLFHFDNHLLKKNHCSCSALRKEPKRNKSLKVLLKQQWYFQSLVWVEVERKNHLKSRQKDFLLLSYCLESMNSVQIQNIPNHINFLSSYHLCKTIQQGQLQSEITFLSLCPQAMLSLQMFHLQTHTFYVCAFIITILWIKPMLCGLSWWCNTV